MAVPNAAEPLQLDAFAGVTRWLQLAECEKKKTPKTTMAMPPILSTVSSDCTFPPNATVKQLMIEKIRIAETATICFVPNCQFIVCPRKRKVLSAQTVVIGNIADRNVANPTPRMAMEPVEATINLIHP